MKTQTLGYRLSYYSVLEWSKTVLAFWREYESQNFAETFGVLKCINFHSDFQFIPLLTLNGVEPTLTEQPACLCMVSWLLSSNIVRLRCSTSFWSAAFLWRSSWTWISSSWIRSIFRCRHFEAAMRFRARFRSSFRRSWSSRSKELKFRKKN